MTIVIAGRKLHYVEQGKGQTIIFIHSSLTDYRSWPSQIELLSSMYHVISYSRRFAYPNKQIGDEFAENTIHANATDLTELIQKLGVAPAHLIGHSSGAFIALHSAYSNPALIRTLTLGEPSVFQLLATSPNKDDVSLFESYRDGAARQADEALRKGDYEKAVRTVLDEAMGVQNVFDHVPEQTRKLLMDNAESVRGELASEIKTPFTIKDAARMDVPTLFVRGENSPSIFHRIVEILRENMPNTEQATIPGVTHDLGRTSKADLFNSKVTEFLAKH
jgi:pimeloyl-ACP methyl ester carboxylesterase